MSFLVSLSRIAKNIIVAGDQNQLQSISILPETEGGESVLDFLVGKGCKVIPKSKGYFLDKTYRMNTNIAKIVSDVFYESKLSWVARKDGGTINLIKTPSSRGSKINKAEALEVIKLYKKLIKEKHKPETIAIITPFNAQVNFIKSILHKNKKSKFNKTTVSSADGIQGATVTTALISTVSSGHKKDAILNAFATFPNRLNVSISRAKEAVYIFTNDGLINSKDSSPEFKQVIKMIED